MTWPIEVAARTLWQEARGEPLIGKQAVVHVMYNRVKAGRWGPNLATVCLWRSQFSGWLSADPNFRACCILPDDDPVLADCRAIVKAVRDQADFTNGATHYYAKSMKTPPEWSKAMAFKGEFGNHRFWGEGAPLIV